jgi:4-amino-4-deoxy-L-arabinose transferase-like glycosyltransferase
VAATFVAGVSLYRFGAVREARYPGHADPAFYYGVAQNIRGGRGATTNYIWEFLAGQPRLPRYAFDHWLPLAPVVMSWALHASNTLAAALRVNVVASIVLAIGTYLLARQLGRTPWVAPASAAVVSVLPVVTMFSVQSEATIYFGTFAVLAMAAAVAARSRRWMWPITGALAALANLSRNEGLVLFVVVAVSAMLSSPRGRRWWCVGGAAVGYVLTMLPLYLASLHHLGTLMPPAGSSFPYVTSYEGLYAVHVPHSLHAFLGGSVVDFVHLRADRVVAQVTTVDAAMLPVDLALLVFTAGACLIGLGAEQRFGPAGRWWRAPIQQQLWWRAGASPWFVPVGFAAAEFLFYPVLTPIVSTGGTLSRGMIAIAPVLVVGGLTQLGRLRVPVWLIAGVVGILVVAPLLSTATNTRGQIANNNSIGTSAAAFRAVFAHEQQCLGRPIVVMTRNPWELTQATGVRTVMIPYGSLEDVLAVARRYGVTDLLMDGRRQAELGPAIDQAARGVGPFVREQFGQTVYYRIRGVGAGARC